MKYMKKIIAPVIITLIFIVYAVVFIVFIANMDLPRITKILGAVIPALLCGVTLFVVIERIHEIRSGEEDDLGKY